jgi:hypothetical protein
MMQKIKEWLDFIKNAVIHFMPAFVVVLIIITIVGGVASSRKDDKKEDFILSNEFKGAIQNRLVWSISGECFFVRATLDERVHLIRVQDCDKK